MVSRAVKFAVFASVLILRRLSEALKNLALKPFDPGATDANMPSRYDCNVRVPLRIHQPGIIRRLARRFQV